MAPGFNGGSPFESPSDGPNPKPIEEPLPGDGGTRPDPFEEPKGDPPRRPFTPDEQPQS